MTREDVKKLLALIAVAYPQSKFEPSQMTLDLWVDMLSDLPGEVVAASTKRMIATLKYPPTIADIRGAVAQATQDARGMLSAGEAWAKVKKAIGRFGSYRGDEARAWLGEDVWRAVEYIGGWRDLCLSDDPETVRSAQFERRYDAMVAQQSARIQIPASVRDDMARLVGPLTARFALEAGDGA